MLFMTDPNQRPHDQHRPLNAPLEPTQEVVIGDTEEDRVFAQQVFDSSRRSGVPVILKSEPAHGTSQAMIPGYDPRLPGVTAGDETSVPSVADVPSLHLLDEPLPSVRLRGESVPGQSEDGPKKIA